MVEQEQREEERYKKLDEAIRGTQKARTGNRSFQRWNLQEKESVLPKE